MVLTAADQRLTDTVEEKDLANAALIFASRTIVDPCRDDEFIEVSPGVLSIADEMIE
jgi:hypothetical protein